jgi:hypothetical protein
MRKLNRSLAESGWNGVPGVPTWVGTEFPEFQPDSARERSHNLHETYHLPCVH